MLATLTSICILFIAGQIYFEYQHHKKNIGPWVGVTKTIGSALFVCIALFAYAHETREGPILLGGLVLCLTGDVFLISQKRIFFLLGLISFLLAHLAYCTMFIAMKANIIVLAMAAPIVFGIGFFIWNWLAPHITTSMKPPVAAYIFTICTMVTLATGVAVMHQWWQFFLAAALFMASDIFVAKDRFIKAAFQNRLLGLPLYYSAQLIFATGHTFTLP